MSTESKPVAPPEKSLSYIAWSLKEISANLTKLVAIQEKLLERNPKDPDSDSPF